MRHWLGLGHGESFHSGHLVLGCMDIPLLLHGTSRRQLRVARLSYWCSYFSAPRPVSQKKQQNAHSISSTRLEGHKAPPSINKAPSEHFICQASHRGPISFGEKTSILPLDWGKATTFLIAVLYQIFQSKVYPSFTKLQITTQNIYMTQNIMRCQCKNSINTLNLTFCKLWDS